MKTAVSQSGIAELVRAGLSRKAKALPPWLFYDAAGSELFERITQLEAYYLTRKERQILLQHSGAIVDACVPETQWQVFELGAGSARKTAHLLRAALERQRCVEYHPLDISLDAMQNAVEYLAQELPEVKVCPEVTDYTQVQPRLPASDAGARKALLWMGSSIGNYEQAEAVAVLRRASAHFRAGDVLLLGVDLHPSEGSKQKQDLILAYDDAEGVTAAFNRNLLLRLNRELGADFRADQFEHRADWNEAADRMEMHLVSRIRQQVHLAELEETFLFQAGESIHTESSYKPTVPQVQELLQQAGFPFVTAWMDPQRWFGVFLGRRCSRPADDPTSMQQ